MILKNKIKEIKYFLNTIGIFPNKFKEGIVNFFPYIFDLIRFKKDNRKKGEFRNITLYPCLNDKNESCGIASGHYFHQDLLVSQKIFLNNPNKHVDIGSRIDGFVAHVAAFRAIEVFDIRPMNNCIHNIIFNNVDIMKKSDAYMEYTDSISSLHAIEHFGLGRYGDNIDADGHIKGLETIYSMLKKNGTFYFSVPIGKQRVEFNAHRVFRISYLLNYFENRYEIKSFYFVNDKGDLIENNEFNEFNIESNFECNFGCGIFELKKI